MPKKHYPEESVSRNYADSMNEHLRGPWCTIRNSIVSDQDAIYRALSSIKAQKATIKFFKERIVANLNALDAIEGIN